MNVLYTRIIAAEDHAVIQHAASYGLPPLPLNPLGELKMRDTKADLDSAETVTFAELEVKAQTEEDFWKRLVNPKQDAPGILKPEEAHLSPETDVLKKKLEDLRNNTVVALLMMNIIWVAMVLSFQIPALEQWGIKQAAFSLLFLVIYFAVLVVQFIALIVHRVETLLHVLARTSMPRKTKGGWWDTPDATFTTSYAQPSTSSA